MIADENAAREYVAARFGSAAVARCERLIAFLAEENTEQNLVAAATLDHAWSRHIVDSLQLLDHVGVGGTAPWLDLGTGAGFPGLAIAVARPDLPMVLVESRKRRCEWLARMIGAFDLAHCRLEPRRLEAVEAFGAGVISARAFAPLDRLLALSARFSTNSTRWVLPKGRSGRQEWEALPAKVRKMFHVEQSLTDAEATILIGRGRPEVRA